MAWQRTALGVGGMGALILHEAAGRLLAGFTGGLGLLAALALLLTADPRYERTMRHIEDGQSPASQTLVRAVSMATLLLAFGAVALVLGGTG